MNHTTFAPAAPLRHLLLLLLLLVPPVMAACGDDEETPTKDEDTYVPPTPNDGKNWILVDRIHTDKQNPSLRLVRNNYNYQGMHGYYRLFQHLQKNDYPYREIFGDDTPGKLTADVLKDYRVLFINLVSENEPDFTADEITAIQDYVRGGGGLFVIADHTNVYYHAQRINPILKPMGIEVSYHTFLDQPPRYGVQGGAWTKIRHFDTEHPINEDVEVTSFQTGGPFLVSGDAYATAWGSPDSWGDFWDESHTSGFYGDWTYDPATEPRGNLIPFAAATYGEGRVAVAGDQNIFGDEWLMVGHNFEIVTNIFEWVAKNDGAETNLRKKLDPKFYHVGMDLGHSDWNVGINSCDGFFPFFINFNRTPQIVARGIERITGDEEALVFPDPSQAFLPSEIDSIKAILAKGGYVIVMTDVVTGRAGGVDLLKQLTPDLSFKVGDQTHTLDDLPLSKDSATAYHDDAFPVQSTFFDVSGMKMAGHDYTGATKQVDGATIPARCPDDVDFSRPYLRRVTSELGEPLLQATLPDGEVVDLARIVDLNGGKLIVFLQYGFWRNETLGMERQNPTTATADAHQIQYRFLDWLIKQGVGAVPSDFNP